MTGIESLTLRDRVRALQRGALAQLARSDRIDNGMLRLVADTAATLAALDTEAANALAPERDARAVVLDDGVTLTLAVFTADRQAACAVLTAAGAVQLARRLLDAASRRL
jgi:hypothetical protein